MGGVRLGEGFVECEKSPHGREPRRGVAVVAVESELRRTGRLADHEHIHLALVGGVGRPCVEGEMARGFGIAGGGPGAEHGQPDVLKHVDGVEVVGRPIGLAGGEDEEQQSGRRPGGGCKARDASPPVGEWAASAY